MSQQVDHRIVAKLSEFFGEGIRSIKEMQRIINPYVKKELFRGENVPPPENRRFFPLARDIRNHMYRATTKLRLSKIDQENLSMKVKEWKKAAPTDLFYLQCYSEMQDVDDQKEQLFYNENGNRIDIKVGVGKYKNTRIYKENYNISRTKNPHTFATENLTLLKYTWDYQDQPPHVVTSSERVLE